MPQIRCGTPSEPLIARTKTAGFCAVAAAAALASGCGVYRSDKTQGPAPVPPKAASTTPAPPPHHPGWPRLVDCLAGGGFHVSRTGSGEFTVTTAKGTDTTRVHVFHSSSAARKFAAAQTGLNDTVGKLVAVYGTSAGPVRDGIAACSRR